MACAGYDGMAAIAEALKKTGGSVDPDKFMAALKGMKLMSPRGPIMIDPETRDIVQTVYIRKVEKSERRALQHGVRQVSRRQGPGEMSSRTGTALVAYGIFSIASNNRGSCHGASEGSVASHALSGSRYHS